MLGGQTLPMAPFVAPFSLGDTIAPFEAISSDDGFPSLNGLGYNFLTEGSVSTSFGGASAVDNDTNMDDGAWDFWNQTFDP